MLCVFSCSLLVSVAQHSTTCRATHTGGFYACACARRTDALDDAACVRLSARIMRFLLAMQISGVLAMMAYRPKQPPDFRIVQPLGGSKELLTFERMLKVKPYPVSCPYDGIELFGAAEPLRLQPPPSRAVRGTIQRFYRRFLGWRFGRILEHTCDGMSRVPGRGSRGRGHCL